MKVHHIGYAVNSIESAFEQFKLLGFTKESFQIDESRKVSIAFIRNGDTLVELIEPCGEGSPVEELLKKSGPAPYHICYCAECIDDVLPELKKAGWAVISKKAEAPAISGAPVVFLYNKEAGLIELVEEK